MKTHKIMLFLRLVSAAILLQTLYFKFSGAAESKFIFSQLGMEPWGRLLSGVSELIAAILLLIPVTSILGAGMAMGIMTGALLSHLLVLGIVVLDDKGLLFSLACTVFICCANIVFFQRQQIPPLINKLRSLYGR